VIAPWSCWASSPDCIGAEYFDWSRFDRFMKRATVLMNTFAEMKLMLVQVNEASKPKEPDGD
jgi:hypothetical protein